MENVVREYQAWRQKKQRDFQIQSDEDRQRHLRGVANSFYRPPYVPLPPPDLSFQAFIEEYEDTMPLDH